MATRFSSKQGGGKPVNPRCFEKKHKGSARRYRILFCSPASLLAAYFIRICLNLFSHMCLNSHTSSDWTARHSSSTINLRSGALYKSYWSFRKTRVAPTCPCARLEKRPYSLSWAKHSSQFRENKFCDDLFSKLGTSYRIKIEHYSLFS